MRRILLAGLLIALGMRAQVFEDSPRLSTLVRGGNAYLSLHDAIALALENNLDLELQRLGSRPEKVLETVRIVRFALATKIIGDAEPVFEALQKR